MPTLMETTLKFDCTRLEEQVLLNKEKDVQLDTRVTALENKETSVYTPTDLDLNTGIVAVTYDTIDGLSLTTQGTIKSNTGTDQVVVDYSIPIIGSDTISIDLDQANDKLVFKLDQRKDIKLIGGSNNNVYFISDSSASIGAPEGSIYSSFGDENGISRILHKDPGGLITYTFPTNTYGEHTVLTSKYVKTLFGNKSIVGSGNIDLFRHHIQCQQGSAVGYGHIDIDIISSKNLKVDSLTDLKTILGDTFRYPAFGQGGGNSYMVLGVNQNGPLGYPTDGIVVETQYPWSNWTFTDTVTTI